MKDVLRVVSLRKTYQRTRVLDGVSFEAAPGEIVGLLGANGAGKTTVLHCIAGLTRPDSGIIEFDGVPRTDARRLVGLCTSADRSFYFRLSLRANLEFFARLYGLYGTRLKERVDTVLDCVNLREYDAQTYAQTSTGMRQRLALARSLLHDPPVLLLDEPTRAVDALHAARFRAYLRETLVTQQRKTIVLATNLLEEAWSLCDRVVFLSNGRGRAINTPAAFGSMQRMLFEVVR